MTRILPHLALTLALAGPAGGAVRSRQAATPSLRLSISAGGDSFAPVLSGDGRWVVFLSAAPNLVVNDDLGPHLDVFVHDLHTTNTLLVSVNQSGIGGGNASAHSPVISSNGQYIAFESAADNLVPNDTNGVADVFVRDLVAGTTTLASVGAFGPGGTNGASTCPLLSQDGRWVFFESTATNLVADDTNGVADVFARDRTMGITTRVSDAVLSTGMLFWAAGSPAISPDGRFVTFVKAPTNSPFVPDISGEVFLRDLLGTTTWVTTNLSNQISGGSLRCWNPVVSAEGRYVTFIVTGSGSRLYRHDLVLNTNELVMTEVPADSLPQTSADGRFIAAGGAPPGQTATGLSIWDGASGMLRTICVDGPGLGSVCAEFPVVSANGEMMAYVTSNGVFTASPLTLLASGVSLNTNGALRSAVALSEPSLSADGLRVAFETTAADLVAEDFNQAADVFVFDRPTATTRMVSRRSPGLPSLTAAGQLSVSRPALSAGGRFIAFAGEDKPSVSEDTNGLRDVILHDLAMGSNTLVGAGAFVWITNGMPATNLLQPKLPSNNPLLGADARFVTFERVGVGSIPAGVYQHDGAAGTWTVVSQQPNGILVDGAAPAVTADGRFVAFQSRANAVLMDGTIEFAASSLDVFVRDMAATNVQTRVVSLSTNGMAGTGESRNPVFSPDGQWVVFQSTSSRLVTNAVNGGHQLFARHLGTGQTKLVSFQPNGAGLVLGGTNPVFSADSRFVLFQETNNASTTAIFRHDLAGLAGVTNEVVCPNCTAPSVSADGRWVAYQTRGTVTVSQVFVKDMQTGDTSLMSVNASRTGVGNGPSLAPHISHDGHYVVFASQASDLVDLDDNGLTDVFVQDRWTGTMLLASLHRQGLASGHGPSTSPVLAANGRTFAFLSHAGDLMSGDFNDRRDILVLRLGGPNSDDDGMEDDWELAYFGTLDRDGFGDFDSDGLNDLAEFMAGTDPLNTGSVLRVLTLTALANGNKTLLWSAVPGRTYRVQSREAVATQPWTDLPVPPVTAVGTTASQIDAHAGTASERFYRVLALP